MTRAREVARLIKTNNLNIDPLAGIVTANGGFNVGIQSAGLTVTAGQLKAINFVGTGNTFKYNSDTKVVDVSIASSTGGGSGSGSAFASVLIFGR